LIQYQPNGWRKKAGTKFNINQFKLEQLSVEKTEIDLWLLFTEPGVFFFYFCPSSSWVYIKFKLIFN
jgi:hypothetical protein